MGRPGRFVDASGAAALSLAGAHCATNPRVGAASGLTEEIVVNNIVSKITIFGSGAVGGCSLIPSPVPVWDGTTGFCSRPPCPRKKIQATFMGLWQLRAA